MKKFGLLLIVLTTLLLFGCSKKSVLTYREFKETVEKEKYTVVDVKDQFKEYDYINGAYLAVGPDTNHQIEFYTFDDEEGSKAFYKVNKETLKSFADNEDIEKNIDKKNYSSYELTTSDKYIYIKRLDNTIVYSVNDKDYKDEIKKIIKKLGY